MEKLSESLLSRDSTDYIPSPSPHSTNEYSGMTIDMNNFGSVLMGNKSCDSDDSDDEKEDDKNIAYYSFLNHKNNKDKFKDSQFAIEPRNKRMIHAKAVANQEKEVVRNLTLNIQRREMKMTSADLTSKNDTIDSSNSNFTTQLNTLIEFMEEEEYNNPVEKDQETRAPSPLQLVIPVDSPKVVRDKKRMPMEAGKVTETGNSDNSAASAKSKKQKSKARKKAESALSTAPELSELSLRLSNLIGSGMLDTLCTIQDRLSVIDTLSADMEDYTAYNHAVYSVDATQATETNEVNNNIFLCDGSITASSLAKSQWENYGKKAYTEEGIEIANLLLEKHNLSISKIQRYSPKREYKNENNGSILYSLRSLPKALSVATTYMKSAVSPSRKKKGSVYPAAVATIQQSKRKVYPCDASEPSDDGEGVLLMDYMNKLAIVAMDDESDAVDGDFLGCDDARNDTISDIADMTGVEYCAATDITESLHGIEESHIDGAFVNDGIADSTINLTANNNIDAPEDTQVDVSEDTLVDVSEDTQVDVSEDTQVDVSEDTQVDAPVDTQVDAPVDTQVDVSEDTQVDALVDTQVDAPENTQVDAPVDTQVDAPVDTQVDTPVDTQVDTNTQVEQDEAVAAHHVDDLIDDIIEDV